MKSFLLGGLLILYSISSFSQSSYDDTMVKPQYSSGSSRYTDPNYVPPLPTRLPSYNSSLNTPQSEQPYIEPSTSAPSQNTMQELWDKGIQTPAEKSSEQLLNMGYNVEELATEDDIDGVNNNIDNTYYALISAGEKQFKVIIILLSVICVLMGALVALLVVIYRRKRRQMIEGSELSDVS